MSLIWGDIRKYQPIRGPRDSLDDEERSMLSGITPDHIDRGVFRKNIFAIWPEFSGLENELDWECKMWDDLREICRLGFDTTRYACEILKHTIQWDIQPAYRIDDHSGLSEKGSYGATTLHLTKQSPKKFKILIEIAADQVWQLLVDEYSPAEKACISFSLAVVMLHELAVSASPARGPHADRRRYFLSSFLSSFIFY